MQIVGNKIQKSIYSHSDDWTILIEDSEFK